MIENPMAFGIELTIVGLLVVFVALVLISVLVATVIGRVDQWVDSAKSRRVEHAPPAPVAAPVMMEEVSPADLTPDLMAVISAAVAVAIDKRARITAIRYRRTPAATSWSVQGRTTIMGSHKIHPY